MSFICERSINVFMAVHKRKRKCALDDFCCSKTLNVFGRLNFKLSYMSAGSAKEFARLGIKLGMYEAT